MCLLFYISGNLIHIPITILKEGTIKYKLQMFLHHFISVGTFIYVLKYDYLYFYSCAASCCELSTIF